MKVNSQFSALRRGALDLSLVPLSYAGGEVPETNIGLLPALVPSYEIGSKWKNAEVGKLLSQILAEKGVIVVTWIWQAGGVASRSKPLVGPDDAKGMKIRGGSREMDMMFKDAGASVLSLPSNEIYAAMQTGAMDAALTSSTSLISFRLEEVSKFLTSGRGKSYWFMFEPLMMSKQIFDKLPKPQQDAIMAVGADLEKFAVDSAMADDVAVAGVYVKAGAKVSDLDDAALQEMASAGEARMEGLRRQERELREAPGGGREAPLSSRASECTRRVASHETQAGGIRSALLCRDRAKRGQPRDVDRRHGGAARRRAGADL